MLLVRRFGYLVFQISGSNLIYVYLVKLLRKCVRFSFLDIKIGSDHDLDKG